MAEVGLANGEMVSCHLVWDDPMRTFDECELRFPGKFVWSTTTVDAELLVSLQFNKKKREIAIHL